MDCFSGFLDSTLRKKRRLYNPVSEYCYYLTFSVQFGIFLSYFYSNAVIVNINNGSTTCV